MSNNQLIKEEKEKLTVSFEVEGQTVSLNPGIVRQMLVNGNGNVSDQEVTYFIALCKARKLNPFVKDAYLIKFGDSLPATMVVAKDVLERRAIKNPAYKGKKVGIYVLNENKEFLKRDHTILLETETLVGAWCEVYRKDWEYPAKIDVNLEEYIGKTKDGSPNKQWASKPVTMITKVAKAQALREAFIEELQGMYEAEEVESTIPNVKEIMEQPRFDESTREAMAETSKILEAKKTANTPLTVEEDDEIQDIFK